MLGLPFSAVNYGFSSYEYKKKSLQEKSFNSVVKIITQKIQPSAHDTESYGVTSRVNTEQDICQDIQSLNPTFVQWEFTVAFQRGTDTVGDEQEPLSEPIFKDLGPDRE